MRIDMHCHALGKGNDITAVDEEVYFNPEDNQHWFTRILYNLLEEDLVRMEADLNQDDDIDGRVFLVALQAAFDIRGTRCAGAPGDRRRILAEGREAR